MGVYWKIAAYDPIGLAQFLDPIDFGENIKRPYDCPVTLKAVALLCCYGSWIGCEIRFISDASAAQEEYYSLAEPNSKSSKSEADELLAQFA